MVLSHIEIEESRIKQETSLKTESIKALQYESVQIIHAKAEQVQQQIDAQAQIKRKEGELISTVEAKKITADIEAKCTMLRAQANAEAAVNSSAAKITGAKAERENAQKLALKREYTEKLEQAKSERRVASESKIVVSGENAQGILRYFQEASRLHK